MGDTLDIVPLVVGVVGVFVTHPGDTVPANFALVLLESDVRPPVHHKMIFQLFPVWLCVGWEILPNG